MNLKDILYNNRNLQYFFALSFFPPILITFESATYIY